MLHGHIFIPERLCLVLGIDQHLVQHLTDIDLSALHLRALVQSLLHAVDKMLLLNFHLFYQL